MNHEVRLLFREVADLPPAERERVFSSRQIDPEIRAEVESLLSFDSGATQPFPVSISHLAQEALRFVEPGRPRSCGPYRLVRLLGSGGMGSVYLAERADGEIRQRVAVKLLHAGTEHTSWRERFLQERQVLADLNHPSVARLLDAGSTEDGRPYLVMEYVEGAAIDVYAAGKSLREKLALFLQVCEGVAHAHQHLIIHRDLKPSNILVDALGQPKLLDFGIAKLLDPAADTTRTVERLLTPNYASPEQIQGGVQTTATDVYSLGAVLYKLLTDRSPHEHEPDRPPVPGTATGGREIAEACRLNPDLPRDLGYILRKALRAEPGERYISVDAFANDVRAFLESRPVQARSGDSWYRARKFLRRYWIPAAAAALVSGSLAAGLYIANSERRVAERRFAQLRQLSRKVFDLDNAIRNLPGSIQARESLVAASLEYLGGLSFDPAKDLDLAAEVAEGYWRVGHIQGVPSDLNLGEDARAEASLQRADALMDVVVAARPRDRQALRQAALIAEDRMILAESNHRRADALAYARKAAQRAGAFLDPHPSRSDADWAAVIYGNIALAHNNMHLYADAARYARRAADLTRTAGSAPMRLSQALSHLANALRYQGDLDGSLRAIEEARQLLEQATYRDPTDRMINLYGVLWREGVILGEDGGVNLGRTAEAIGVLQESLDLVEQAARRDPKDSTSRSRVGTAARELGSILRHQDSARALAVYDLGIRRLAEIPGNLKAARDRAQLLADSAYPLRALHRTAEARQRTARALEILSRTKDYPSASIQIDSELCTVLRGAADEYAAEGETARAVRTYEQLLNGIMASHPDPLNDLRDAPRMSAIYQSMAALYRKTGETEKAESFTERQRQLWQTWNQKLPNNAFVLRQLAATAN